MSEECKKYACDLLSQCRSSEEVIAVLNQPNDSDDDEDEDDDDDDGSNKPPEIDLEYLELHRLKMALKYEQKQVKCLVYSIFSTLNEAVLFVPFSSCRTLTANRC